MKTSHSQFVFAREYRGLSQTELSKKIKGLSQSNLSKFEKGFDILSEEIINSIVDVLDFPSSFFRKNIYNNVGSAHYRLKSGVTKSLRTQLEINNRMIGYIVDELGDSVSFPDFTFRSMDAEEYSPEYIAKYTRKLIGLKRNEPVVDIFHLLESNGVIVIEFDPETEKFDGVSFVSDNGVPIVIINKNFSNDRKRFTLAHELGHTIMHNTGDFPVSNYRTDKEIENEANRFASEFLMPEEDVRNSLTGLMLQDLAPLKKYWHTSKASIIHRAVSLNCINKNRATHFRIELSRAGERKRESTLVMIDKPVVFKQAYDLHKTKLNYSNEDIAKAFSLPMHAINKYLNFSEKGKLRIIV